MNFEKTKPIIWSWYLVSDPRRFLTHYVTHQVKSFKRFRNDPFVLTFIFPKSERTGPVLAGPGGCVHLFTWKLVNNKLVWLENLNPAHRMSCSHQYGLCTTPRIYRGLINLPYLYVIISQHHVRTLQSTHGGQSVASFIWSYCAGYYLLIM